MVIEKKYHYLYKKIRNEEIINVYYYIRAKIMVKWIKRKINIIGLYITMYVGRIFSLIERIHDKQQQQQQ
jgi:hypothetical protein